MTPDPGRHPEVKRCGPGLTQLEHGGRREAAGVTESVSLVVAYMHMCFFVCVCLCVGLYTHWRVSSVHSSHQPGAWHSELQACPVAMQMRREGGCKIWILITATSPHLSASDTNEAPSAVGVDGVGGRNDSARDFLYHECKQSQRKQKIYLGFDLYMQTVLQCH